ncbi:MAG: lpxP, partial [Myxococcaceae bacterium]|nr:lpxP [Myxococcaceae bacterium]
MSGGAARPAVTPGGPVASLLAALAIGLLRALPPAARTALARLVARVAFALGIRRRITLDNLARAFPEKPQAERVQLARAAYANMALAAVESICSDLIPDAELERAVQASQAGSWPSLEALLVGSKPVLI